MLVLSMRSRESVVIGGTDGLHRLLRVTVLGIHGTNVKVGFEVDPDVPVHRSEMGERIQSEGQCERPKSSTPTANEEMDRWEDDGGPPPDTTPREALCSEMP
jgi:carbon storage regulator CsrA